MMKKGIIAALAFAAMACPSCSTGWEYGYGEWRKDGFVSVTVEDVTYGASNYDLLWYKERTSNALMGIALRIRIKPTSSNPNPVTWVKRYENCRYIVTERSEG